MFRSWRRDEPLPVHNAARRTGFLATRESFAHGYHKQRIIEAKPVGEAMHILGIQEARPNAGGVPEFSSPACSMHEASDAYMGYAG
jgi:hypothetical protein